MKSAEMRICNLSEGVKKLVVCGSAHEDGCLVEVLGYGSSNVMDIGRV
jgi:hypothetical protein